MLEVIILCLAVILSMFFKKYIKEEMNEKFTLYFIVFLTFLSFIFLLINILAFPLLIMVILYAKYKSKKIILLAIFYLFLLSFFLNNDYNFILSLSMIILLTWLY